MKIELNVPPKLKEFWQEHPVETIVIGTAVITAASKVIDSISSVRSRNAYAKRMNNGPKSARR